MSSFSSNQLEKQRSTNDNDNVINIKEIVLKIVNNWFIFVAGVIICLFLSYLYAYYSSAKWMVSSKILVEDSKNNAANLGNTSGLGANFSSVFNARSSADNEIQILKSRSLMENTVKQLQLNVRIYSKSGLKTTEIYQEAPFTIKLYDKADTLVFEKYQIKLNHGGKYSIVNSKEKLDLSAKVGETIKLDQYDMVLDALPGHSFSGEYVITVESVDATVTQLSADFKPTLSDRQATSIDLSLTYPHSKKGEVILEELMRLYLFSNLQNKVQIANNTVEFIDGRIGLIKDELTDIEHKFEEYKVTNGIADISAQSKGLVASASEYYDKLNQIETQLKIFDDLTKILADSKNKSTIPSSMVAPTDIAFGQGISAYNQLLIERDRASLAYTDNNPIIENFNQQIETARKALLRNVMAYKSNLEISKLELKKQNGSLNDKLQAVPAKERGYLDFQRTQSLKQDLYLYLLQKREEAAISKTSTISSSRIIDHAKSDFLPFKPQKSVIYFVGVLLGLIIPGLGLFIIDLLNVKIQTKQDIQKLTSVTIAGEIGHNVNQDTLVAINNSRTVISEQFRSLRTKLSYLLNSSKSNVILFTSSMGGEGKSFLSVNLGSAIALTGKTVVFIELDLRKPKLSEIMGHDHNVEGYSNYVVSEFMDISKIVKPIWFNENCSLVSSGPIPPNPTELLASKKLGVLIDDLKARFDYIIIDCAPIGLVTDALLVQKFADLTLYVVRENYTYKSQLSIINELKVNEEINNMYIILNDIQIKKEGYSSYGYGVEKNNGWKKHFLKKG